MVCPRPHASVGVEGRKERVLEGAVLRRLAQVVVHLPGGREDALDAGRREGRRQVLLAWPSWQAWAMLTP